MKPFVYAVIAAAVGAALVVAVTTYVTPVRKALTGKA